jgi:hypothetical protein
MAAALPSSQTTGATLTLGDYASYPTYPRYQNYWCYNWGYQNYWDYQQYWVYQGYWPYYSYCNYYYLPPVETPKTFELKVATSPSGVTSVIGGGTYNQGTVASFSVTSTIVPFGSQQEYVFSHWSGDFSGSDPAGSVTMDSGKTIVANYYLQSYLKVSTDPPAVTTVGGEGWYRLGESVTLGPVSAMIPADDDSRYIFERWTVDGAPVSGSSISVEMDTAHTVVAQYKTQYRVTVLSDYGVTSGAGWYDAGSDATVSVTTQVDTGFGVKQVFDRWTGDSQSASPAVTVTVNSPLTFRASWRTDSTILYATLALGICGILLVGIVLLAMVFMRRTEAKPTPVSPPETVATVEAAHEKAKRPRTRKKAKPPPKTEGPEPTA